MELEKGKEYVRPEEVPASQAEKVLAFLNAAKTAEEIAEAVEFPKERDVGIKIAQNILDRRAELGGFKNLKQVDEVPQVGPERFAEIVRALGEGEDSISRKLDGTMRRLLKMSEAEIRRQFQRDRRRLAQKRKEIEERIRTLSPTASESDRNAVARVNEILQSRLIPHQNLIPVIPGRLRPVRIRAIVRFTGNRADLEAMGIEVRSQAHDVFTIVGTRQQLQDLASQPACRRLRTPRILFPTVEHASAQAEIANVHDPRPVNPNGFRGNGVLVGIIDSPLDVTHHGFRDPDPLGTHDSRVLYYWAQSTHAQGIAILDPPGQTPQGFTNAGAPGTRPDFGGLNYGRLYTNNDINTALAQTNPYGTDHAPNQPDVPIQICCEPGWREHGTHCAGIAAGSGHVTDWNTDPRHVGAAPEATIIFVRYERLVVDTDPAHSHALDATFEDAILDGIDFCLRAAQFHQMPIVISVSLGSNWGPHNGSTDFDLARDNLLNSFDNRSIVFAAGNDNNDNGYRRGSVAAGNIESITLTAQWEPLWLDVWYAGPELDYRISFVGPNSEWVFTSEWLTAGHDYWGQLDGRHIEAARDIEPGGGLQGIRIYWPVAWPGETYTIELRNPTYTQAVNYHAWVGPQGWYADLSGSTQNETTLSDAGCGKSILTVGACNKVRPPNPASGEQITAYSGAGPTVDGRIKPEIVAVGGCDPDKVFSTASDQNSEYVGKHGTSMATPLVTGAVALLFEEYGSPPPVGLGRDLNQDTIKALITQYANRLNLNLEPTQPGYVAEERNRYGYGRLRMIGPIDHIRPPIDVDLWVRTADDDYGEEPYPGGCFCAAPDIRVFKAGRNKETTDIKCGTIYDVRVTVRNLGDTDAVGAVVRLKYTLLHAAPDSWFEAEDASNNKLVDTVTVPAMGSVEVRFHWCPKAGEVVPSPFRPTHLLAEVDHAADPLVYPAPTTGGSAWSANIKGTNNVALRSLHIL